jgi:hypothetical protein
MPKIQFTGTRLVKGERLTYEGRNGVGYQLGINMYRANDRLSSVILAPMNSQGFDGPSHIQVPYECLDEFINALRATAQVQKEPTSVELLMANEPWSQHPVYDREQWMLEVAMKNTQRGYWDWVQHRVELEEMEADDAVLPSANSVGQPEQG